jgi:hypothetical protein
MGLLFSNASADHEPDHRYVIRGYVVDTNDRGIANQTIQVFAQTELLGTEKTDGDGYYSMHLHLHNEDYGRRLRLRAGTLEAELRVNFDRADSVSARTHEANFVGGKLVEGQLQRFRVPSWSYAVGGLVLFMLIAVILERRRKKKIRLAKHGSGEKHSPSGHKAKKIRRRKHKS